MNYIRNSVSWIVDSVSLAFARQSCENMDSDTFTKWTVEGLKGVIRNTVPAGEKPRNLKAQSGTVLFVNRDFSFALPVNNFDKVYPGIYLGDQKLARDHALLKRVGITHLLNAAQGQKFAQIDTTAAYYVDVNIKFMGINAMDSSKFKLADYFEEGAAFIDEAIRYGGNVYVHCFQGISRSATLVIVYLMLYQRLSLEQALVTLRQKRAVFPNDGFLKQLAELEEQLYQKRKEEVDVEGEEDGEKGTISEGQSQEERDGEDIVAGARGEAETADSQKATDSLEQSDERKDCVD